MNLAYITDIHARGLTPSGRKGSFLDDLKVKIKEVIDIGNKCDVKWYLSGGDVFDVPIVSNSVVDTVADLLEGSGREWYSVFGNHDEVGNNPDLSGASSLGHLFRRSKSIQHLNVKDITTDIGKKVRIKGFDYRHGIERDILENGLMVGGEFDLKIAVVHAYVLPDSITLPFEKVLYSELKTDANIVLLSHYHGDSGLYIRQDGVQFVSVGALARLTLAKIDVDRIPKMAVININTGFVQIIPLKNFKSKEEVFKLDQKAEVIEKNLMIGDFLRSLESTKVQGLNLRGVVQEIADQNSVDKEVVNEVMDRISKFEV